MIVSLVLFCFVSHIYNCSCLTNSWISMFFFFLFGCMEIRAEDCLTGIGHRGLELDGSILGWELVWKLLSAVSGLVSFTLGFGNIFLVSLCIMSVRLRIVPFSWFVLWPCSGTVV